MEQDTGVPWTRVQFTLPHGDVRPEALLSSLLAEWVEEGETEKQLEVDLCSKEYLPSRDLSDL